MMLRESFLQRGRLEIVDVLTCYFNDEGKVERGYEFSLLHFLVNAMNFVIVIINVQ